jgi:2-hydroxychromene-2-carboxylate isomerase
VFARGSLSDVAPRDAAFYFDLAEPECYLASERLPQLLPRPLEWLPVLGSGLAAASQQVGRSQLERSQLEHRAAELGLPALRWPAQYPFDSEEAMLVATYAKGIGRVVAFSQAAFRQAFAAARALAEIDNVLIAAAACELHPAAVLAATGLESVRRRLAETTSDARRAGITRLPALRVAGQLFLGERGLDEAAALAAGTFAPSAGALAR